MIVVTAPTGNVGSEVTRLLITHTPILPFRIASHHPKQIQQIYGAEVPCTPLDFGDASTWHAALEGVSILFLVCPQPDPKVIRTQILPFIDAAIAEGCQHIIYLSVPGAGRTKIIPHYRIERYIESSHIAYTFLRPSYFMQNFIRKASTHGIDIATRHEIFIPAGRGRISLIDARDVAQVVIKICEKPDSYKKQSYNLTAAESLDLYEVAKTFSQVLNEPIRYTHPSLPRFWYRLRKRKISWLLLLVMTVEYVVASLGKSGETNNTLVEIIGRPPTTLAQFIKDNQSRWITQSWV